MTSRLVKIEDVAKICQLSAATIEYYLDLGLIRVGARQGRTRLLEKEEALKRINTIKNFLDQGLSLKVIKQKMNGHFNGVSFPGKFKKFLSNRFFVLFLGWAGFYVLGFFAGRRI